MKKIFDLDNPIWRFIGNLADFFLLSVYWYLCAIIIIPMGAGTTAMHSVTLKMASHTEGYTTKGFFKAFKDNFRQGTVMGLCYLGVGLVITIDFYWIFFGNPKVGVYFLPLAIMIAAVYLLCANFTFPMLSHYDNDTKSLLILGVSYTFKNLVPVFSYTLLTIGIFALGIFVFWPILLIAPGLSAYISAFILNRIFTKYDRNADSSQSD